MEIELQKAFIMARNIVYHLQDLCTDIEIVGSVKRGERMVGDIEILMILDPTVKAPRLQFGQKKIYKTALDYRLDSQDFPYPLQEAIHKANGDALKRFAFTELSRPMDDFCLELFIVKPETWGIQNVIRTGPKEFSKRYVTNVREGGLLPNHLRYVTGMTRIQKADTGEFLDLRSEQAAIGILSRGWIEPSDRWKLIKNNSL